MCVIILSQAACAFVQDEVAPAPCGNLTIFKYNDHDASGTWNGLSEQRLAGFRFNVSGPVSFSAVTNIQGEVCLFCIPYGDYVITEAVPDGWVNTTPNPVYVSINREDLVVIPFGNRQIPAPTTTSEYYHHYYDHYNDVEYYHHYYDHYLDYSVRKP